MDFKTAPCVTEVPIKSAEHSIFGNAYGFSEADLERIMIEKAKLWIDNRKFDEKRTER